MKLIQKHHYKSTIRLLGLMGIKFLFLCTIAFGQTTVSGTVTDAQSGDPLPGVNIAIKGSTLGTSTNADGQYSLNVPSDSDILVFSFIGYQTREVPINGRTTIDIELQQTAIAGEELVVVGYGTQRRQDVTGSISSITESDFNQGITLAPEDLMQGKVAGVNIIQNSGRPGAGSTVRIRGSSSVSAGNDPLYVIDGVPLQVASASEQFISIAGASTTSPFNSMPSNPLNILNPSDIESINVLKDASATAIYGSRGANGVIMITTKNRSETTVNYDGYVSVSSVRKKMPVLSASEYKDYAESNGLAYPDLGEDTDWQDQIFQNAITHNHNLSFGSSSGPTTYRASIGYNNQEGVVLTSNLEKYTGRINIRHRALDEKLNINLNLTAAGVQEDNVPISANIKNEGGNMLKDALRWAPTLPVKNSDGSFYQIGPLRVNPVSWTQLDDNTERNSLVGNLELTYDILESLNVSVNLGHTNEDINRFIFVPSSHPIAADEGGRASINKVGNESSLIETNLNYVADITENSRLDILAGYSFQEFVVQSTYTAANQFPSDAVKWNLMQAGNTLANSSNKTVNNLSSIYGRINYRLLDRYMLTFTLRNDGSSRFGGNNRWGLFPSGAAAWIVSNEDFFSTTIINNLKVRLGYGITGNQEIPNFLFMEQLSLSGSSTYRLGGETVPSVSPSNYPNPDLKWEETSQLNVGIDFGLFDSRLTGTVDYYVKNTTDLLLQFSTAAPSVVNTQWANVGEVENKGLEISLDGTILQSSELFWSTNLNFSTNANEVIALSNDQFSRDEIRTGNSAGVVQPQESPTQIIKPGLPLRTFWGRKFTGFDENGLETYLDADGDGEADLMAIGNPNPDFTYGFTNTIQWKNFDTSITLRGVVGNDIFNNTAAEYSYPSTLPGTNAFEAALSGEASRNQIANYSSRWIQDGSYLRLANLTVGYTFDAAAIPQLSRARLYISGQNLFVITGYSGFDPEVRTNTHGGGTASIGIDYLSYPRPRTVQVGVSLAF